jgi:hypothetical protein
MQKLNCRPPLSGQHLKPLVLGFFLGRNLEQIEVRECLLSFGAESVVFQVAIQKLKDQDT